MILAGIAVKPVLQNSFLVAVLSEHIFNNLKDGVTGQTIDIRYNYGTYELHPDTIAT